MSAKILDGLTPKQRYRISCAGKLADKNYQYRYTRKPNTRYNKLKSSCKQRSIEITITKDEFINMIGEDCYYCGRLVDVECGSGLDRIDSSIGYILSNIVPCCHRCNIMKNDMSQHEFAERINYIYTNMLTKGVIHV